jgi:hypothetical protein
MEMKKKSFYRVRYNGNSSRYRDREWEVLSSSEKEAVERVYSDIMDWNYFPEAETYEYGGDHIIRDCGGDVIRDENDDRIYYDGGYFYAEKIEDL